MYEGEVTELTPTESENPLSGYGKTVSHVIVGLKTVRGTKQLRLDPSIYEAILKEKIQVGDVIYVEANTGAVKVRPSLMIHSPYAHCVNLRTACWSIRRVRIVLRFGVGDIRPSTEGRRSQTKGVGARCYSWRLGCGQRPSTGRTGYHECHG